MDVMDQMQIVNTNNKTVMIISVVIGLLLLIVGLIWAYARTKSKGKIIRNTGRAKKKYSFDYDEEIEDFGEEKIEETEKNKEE